MGLYKAKFKQLSQDLILGVKWKTQKKSRGLKCSRGIKYDCFEK